MAAGGIAGIVAALSPPSVTQTSSPHARNTPFSPSPTSYPSRTIPSFTPHPSQIVECLEQTLDAKIRFRKDSNGYLPMIHASNFNWPMVITPEGLVSLNGTPGLKKSDSRHQLEAWATYLQVTPNQAHKKLANTCATTISSMQLSPPPKIHYARDQDGCYNLFNVVRWDCDDQKKSGFVKRPRTHTVDGYTGASWKFHQRVSVVGKKPQKGVLYLAPRRPWTKRWNNYNTQCGLECLDVEIVYRKKKSPNNDPGRSPSTSFDTYPHSPLVSIDEVCYCGIEDQDQRETYKQEVCEQNPLCEIMFNKFECDSSELYQDTLIFKNNCQEI